MLHFNVITSGNLCHCACFTSVDVEWQKLRGKGFEGITKQLLRECVLIPKFRERSPSHGQNSTSYCTALVNSIKVQIWYLNIVLTLSIIRNINTLHFVYNEIGHSIYYQ